jgi:glycosyltransferase involved in cell wall biosynthesis
VKILVIVSRDAAHPGAAGGDCHLTQLSRDLAANGHEVTLLTASDPSITRFESHGSLRIVRLAPSRLFFLAVWARLLTDYHGKFDLVVEEAVGGERAPFLARILAGSPTLPFWFQDNRPLFRAIYGRLGVFVASTLQEFLLWLNRDGFALANSNATRSWLIEEGVDPDKVGISYPKVDVATAPAQLLPFERRLDRMVTIGNLRPTKRFEESIRTFALVLQEHPGAELVILGRPQDDGYLRRLRRLAADLNVSSHVSFRLATSEREKFNVLSEAKALTIHSPVEGFGWTISEAGLCGVPVVGNPGVPPDTLREGVNGVRVPFRDLAAYAKVIERLFDDRSFWEPLSMGSRAVALEFAQRFVEPQVSRVLALCAGFERVEGDAQRQMPAPG